MTLLGKALTVAMFVMSVLFMAFAMISYAAHRNWPKLVSSSEAPEGLRQQLTKAQDKTRQLEAEIARLRTKLEVDSVSQLAALVVLETKSQQQLAVVNVREAEYASQLTKQRQSLEAVQRSQTALTALSSEVETIRNKLTATYEERNKRLQDVVSLTDQLHQAQCVLRRLELRNNDLLEQIAP